LSRKKEIKELKSQIQKDTANLTVLAGKFAALENDKNALLDKLNGSSLTKQEKNLLLAKMTTEMESIKREVEKHERHVASVKLENEQNSRKIDELVQKESEIQNYIGSVGKESDGLQLEIANLANHSKEQMAFREEKSLIFNETKVIIAEKQKDKFRIDDEIKRLALEIEDRNNAIGRRENELTQMRERLKELAEFIDKSKVELSVFSSKMSELENENLEIGKKKEEVELQRLELANQLKSLAEEKELHSEETVSLQTKSVANELRREDIRRRLFDSYQITTEDLLKEERQIDFPRVELQQKVTDIKMTLQRMGPVDTMDIDEYQQISERYNNMLTQREDLEKAKDTLKRTIREIQKITIEMFEKTFNEVRENFRHTFRRVFGGGMADIILMDEQNIMESGIEVIAQPPGKTRQPISLLSGGEKALTAISLLFALYMLKPSPFCLLDEIDAPLDDANIIRLTGLIEEFAKKSQFIIITHNKRSMEIADTIYGVTMEEKGVSKIVSMKFGESHVPENMEVTV